MNNSYTRSNELTDIMEPIGCYSTERRIIYVHGEPYIGKTYLKNKIKEKIKEGFYSCTNLGTELPASIYPVQFAMLDCRSIQENNETEFTVVNNLYQQMKKWQNIKFPRYELARNYLYNNSNQTRDDYKINDSLWSGNVIDMILSSLSEILTKHISNEYPIINFLSKKILENPWTKKVFSEIEDFLKNKFYNISAHKFASDITLLLRKQDDREIESMLTQYLWLDLKDYEKSFPSTNIILIDTYEIFSQEEFNWIYYKLIKLSSNIFWIVFGTSLYAFDNIDDSVKECMILSPWKQWENKKHVWSLQRFSEETASELLESHGICKDISSTILDLAKGLPGALCMLINTYQNIIDQGRIPTIEDFKVKSRHDNFYKDLMVDVYLKHLDSRKRKVLCFLSELDKWDYSIYNFYADIERIEFPDDMFKKIIGESIVQAYDSESDNDSEFKNIQYYLLDIPKLVFQQNNSIQQKKKIYKIAYTHYKLLCNNLISEWSNNTVWDSKNYQYFRSIILNATKFGIKQYDNESTFNEFSSWLITVSDSSKGIEQQLTDLQLYSLKEEVLTIYLSKVTEKDNFKYDIFPKGKYQLQALYDLGWSQIYLHSYNSALNKIMNCLTLGLSFYDSTNEINIKCLYSLGVVFQRWGRYYDSAFWHKVALDTRSSAIINNDCDKKKLDSLISISTNSYADALMNLGMFDKAMELFNQSLQLRNKYYSDTDESYNKDDLRGIIAINGNISKLNFLWGVKNKNIDLLNKAESLTQKCIQDCIKLYGDKEDTALDHKVRILTIHFQKDRIRSEHHTNSIDFNSYICCYENFLSYWDRKTNDVADTMHYLLNTQHNLSVVYAYTNNKTESLRLNNLCISKRRSRQQSTVKDNDKNILIEIRNRQILESENPELSQLELIY